MSVERELRKIRKRLDRIEKDQKMIPVHQPVIVPIVVSPPARQHPRGYPYWEYIPPQYPSWSTSTITYGTIDSGNATTLL